MVQPLQPQHQIMFHVMEETMEAQLQIYPEEHQIIITCGTTGKLPQLLPDFLSELIRLR